MGKSIYTQELADRICERLSEGERSLRAICRDEGIPHSSVLHWALKNPAFADQYARAADMATDAEFAGLNDMADEEPPRGPDGKVDSGWVTWQKNRIDARKWGWARRAPKKYGDKVTQEHTGPNGGPMQVEEIRRTVVDPK